MPPSYHSATEGETERMAHAKRRLAAILSADVVGYSRLMEADEEATVAALDARRQIFRDRIAARGGRVVDTAGDSVLATFESVVEAVRCATEVQDALAETNADLPEDRCMRYRIGVNLGDVIEKDDGTIYGDGVNIASRLEGLAEPSGISVSGDVYNQVRNRIEANFEDLGEQAVKNVSSPVRIYRLVSPSKQTEAVISFSVADQIIKFCTASDGVQIAYSTVGQGPAVIIVTNWLSHLDLDWQMPFRLALIDKLAPNHMLIRYDARGNGLSDWEVEDISFEASIRDLVAVIKALDLDRFALLGLSQGAAISAAYAARNPEKVTHLALYGGYARGRRMRGSEGQIAESDAFITMIREGWGKDVDAYVRMFGSFFMPDANADQLAKFTYLQRATTSPENAARIQLAIDSIDISDELTHITTPTLVLHVREDARAAFDEGRRMAAAITGARFVPLEGRNHAMLPGEPAYQRSLDEIQSFLRS